MPPVFGLGGGDSHVPRPVGDMVKLSGPGEPLNDRTRSSLEAGLGADFRTVRVHGDMNSAAAVDRLSARAFTIGNHIFLGSREKATDLSLMAHEATHVVQQQGGASVQRLASGDSGDPFEIEAERSAAAVQRGEHATVSGRTGMQQPQFLFGWVSRGISAVGRGVRAAASAVAEVAGDIIGRAVAYIREHARSIPGYDLLAFILGKDPLTQRPVERNAVNLIRALLGLIPGGSAMFENLQRAGVIERAYTWVQGELARLNLSWAVIRGAIDRFLSTLGPGDILNLGGVFERARVIFGPILSRLLTFAAAAGRKILEFIFEGALALAGGAAQRVLAIFRRIGATFNLIVSDPVRFLRNLINAVKGGFQQFAAKILEHLRTALFDWLFGALQGAGLRLPARFNLEGILSIVLQVLGLTYDRLRARLVRLIGEPAVATLERVFEFLRILVTQGLAAAWQKILEFASGLVDTVIESIRNWVVTTIVKAAVTRIATMFNPVGAIINAIITIYNTVMFVVERARQIAAFVEAVIDSIDNIAHGNIGAAVNYVERTLARILSLVISFLARLIGLGGISDTIRRIIQRIQAVVDRAIDKVVNWIVQRARGLVQTGKRAVGAVLQWWKMKKSVTGDGGQFTLSTEGSESRTRILVASSPGVPWSQYLKTVNAKNKEQKDALVKAKALAAVIEGGRTLPPDQHAKLMEKSFNELAEHIKILNATKSVPASVIEYGGTNSLGGGLEARASILSRIHPEGSSPRDSAPIWTNLENLGAGLGKKVRQTWYVQGHLLNENLGGPGLRFNLTPITKEANNEHKRIVETDLKKLVNVDGEVISYTVKALPPPSKGSNPRLKQLKKIPKPTKDESDELTSLQALQQLTSGFKCTAYILEQDSKGKWTKRKKALDKASKTIENNIERSGNTYGY
ncbi:MAG: DUF4157 domain-containing protein [Chloroflexi bacterium]|nr:DUF4157 domain-containing protein [Chloroflexota bacterium]